MMAKALDINGAKKVYIIGRRLEKLQEVAAVAVGSPPLPHTRFFSLERVKLNDSRLTNLLLPFKATSLQKNPSHL
jgi:hypothetical protein